MSGLAVMVVVGFGVVALWGAFMGLKGCLTEHPPFMQGEGPHRYDPRMKKVA